MQNNYLIESSEALSINKKINELIKKNKFVDNDINYYDLDESTLDIILEDLDTYSFLTPKKVIVIRNINNIDIDCTNGKHFIKYLENPLEDKLLILIADSLDSRKKSTKELKKYTEYIKLESNPIDIIKNELKEFDLDNGVIDLLLEYTNNNIDSIRCECDKLKNYKEYGSLITKEDIKNVCYKVIGDSTNMIFDLVREICSKNKKNSLLLYKKLLDYHADDLSIIGLIESQLRLLEQVSMLSGKSNREIGQLLDVHPYRIEKTFELFRYINVNDVDNLLISLQEMDYNIKSGKLDINRPLEMFIIEL